LNWLKRGLLIIGGLGMLIPTAGHGFLFHWVTDLAGLVITVAVLLPQWLKRKNEIAAVQAADKT